MSSAVFSVSPFSLSLTAQGVAAAAAAANARANCASGRRCHIVAAMAADGRDSLNHQQQQQQQKLSHLYQQQQQKQKPSLPSKRRIAQSAPLGLWDRFPTARTIQQMMDTMDRIMEDPFAFSAVSFPPTAIASDADERLGGYRRGRTPWDIKEGEGEYKMRFDMPGMTKKDVKIWVEDNMLVIKAEKASKKKETGGADGGEGGGSAVAGPQGMEEEEEWVASYGRYSSRIALPESVVVEKIKAEVKDGVLYITLPKAASSSGKVLDIDVQ